jgi:hypothetical protein
VSGLEHDIHGRKSVIHKATTYINEIDTGSANVYVRRKKDERLNDNYRNLLWDQYFAQDINKKTALQTKIRIRQSVELSSLKN